MWRYPHWWAIALCAGAWGWVAARWWGSRHAHGYGALDWTLMVVAMMLPLVFVHLRVAAARSLWSRRHRAIAMFLCGYVAIAVVAGLALFSLAGATGLLVHGAAPPTTVAGAFALAAAWQLLPVKRRALTACHRTMPLAPRGWRANRDCLRYGWTIGGSCLVSCGGLMLACVLAGHSLPVMCFATAVAAAERVTARADAWITSAALALGAAAQFAAGDLV
ncbi:MAG TPA: DUF2182 domain-containing protein [Vicinamibacterales bacterium]|nr:DUF2182 domain-containing protein [Vicinamibacterales bacterium]